MAVRTIEVYANPYCALDADGVPQGVVQMPGTRNYVGAHIDIVASERSGKTRFYFAPPNTAKNERGAHGLRQITVPFTAEIARAINDGALIVADKNGARMVGIKEADFEEPDARLKKEREIALEQRRAFYSKEAKVGNAPTTPTERAVDEKPPAEVVLSGTRANPHVVLKREEV